jgi:hypothetical protein
MSWVGFCSSGNSFFAIVGSGGGLCGRISPILMLSLYCSGGGWGWGCHVKDGLVASRWVMAHGLAHS